MDERAVGARQVGDMERALVGARHQRMARRVERRQALGVETRDFGEQRAVVVEHLAVDRRQAREPQEVFKLLAIMAQLDRVHAHVLARKKRLRIARQIGAARGVPRRAAHKSGTARELARRATDVRGLEAREAEVEVRFGEARLERKGALEQHGSLVEAPLVAHHRAEHAQHVGIARRERGGGFELAHRLRVLGELSVQHAELQVRVGRGRAALERPGVGGNRVARLAGRAPRLGEGEPGGRLARLELGERAALSDQAAQVARCLGGAHGGLERLFLRLFLRFGGAEKRFEHRLAGDYRSRPAVVCKAGLSS